MNVFEYFQSFEIYSNPPYRIVVVIIITQIISESEGHTILLFFISNMFIQTFLCNLYFVIKFGTMASRIDRPKFEYHYWIY